jgi:CubicO group peptidase (beta-lactamase class C family)
MGHEGIIASPHDYVSFLDKLMRGQILQPETLRSMTTFHRAKDREVEYGLGIMRRKVNNVVIIGHNGGGFGTMTYLFFIPENNVTIFFAANIGSLFATPQSDWFYDDLLTEIIQIVND